MSGLPQSIENMFVIAPGAFRALGRSGRSMGRGRAVVNLSWQAYALRETSPGWLGSTVAVIVRHFRIQSSCCLPVRSYGWCADGWICNIGGRTDGS